VFLQVFEEVVHEHKKYGFFEPYFGNEKKFSSRRHSLHNKFWQN